MLTLEETAMSNPPKKKPRLNRGIPTAIGAYVPGIARAAFETHGFPSANILSDWPDIIGAEFAGITSPERLVWPRGPEADTTSRTQHRAVGAILVLRVDGPRSLEVQHIAPQLLERINIYFGYRAVSQLRIVQGPVRREAVREPCPAATANEDFPLDRDIQDEGLRDALSRLAGSLGKTA